MTALTQEETWYFRHNGFHRVRNGLPEELVVRLNAATDREVAGWVEPIVWEGEASGRTEDVRRLSKIPVSYTHLTLPTTPYV